MLKTDHDNLKKMRFISEPGRGVADRTPQRPSSMPRPFSSVSDTVPLSQLDGPNDRIPLQIAGILVTFP